jgi:hypothetical protein
MGLPSDHDVVTNGFFKAFYKEQKLIYRGNLKT